MDSLVSPLVRSRLCWRTLVDTISRASSL